MSQTFTLTFEPLDVLVFKDYRGLEAADQHEARTLSATPTVMQGCVRGALFRQLGADFRSKDAYYGIKEPWSTWLGGRDQQGSLRLRGPWIVEDIRGDKPHSWFPAPIGLPLLCHDAGSRPKARMVDLTDLSGHLAPRFSSQPLAQILRVSPAGDKGGGPPLWVSADRKRCKAADDLFKEERRVGIARDSQTHTASEELFFYQDTLRFADCAGLAVEIDAQDDSQGELINALNGKTVALGGRGHRALLRVLQHGLLPVPASPSWRVWFITPLLRGGDLQPEGTQIESLLTAESSPIGGFDMAKRQPRPLQSTLRAGTVLTLSSLTRSSPPPIHHPWGQPPDAWKAGYGTTLSLGDEP